MSEREKLKPCPFCGGVGSIVMLKGEYVSLPGVRCLSCSGTAGGRVSITVDDGRVSHEEPFAAAVAAWNRRAGGE